MALNSVKNMPYNLTCWKGFFWKPSWTYPSLPIHPLNKQPKIRKEENNIFKELIIQLLHHIGTIKFVYLHQLQSKDYQIIKT